MKKTYMKPTLQVVEIHNHSQLLAGSLQSGSTGVFEIYEDDADDSENL